jgi:predicted membrane-bound spermidine synthase
MHKFKKMIFLVSVFMIGAATLVLEIVGVRLIAPYFGSTIFVWSSLITATLGGLATGYAIGSALSRKEFHEKVFYLSIFAFGILLILLPSLVGVASSFSEQFELRFGPLLASMILFLPLFIFAGVAAPLSVKIYSEIHPAGVAAGRLYALGTVGSLSGALLTGFFLIPILPLSKLLFITAWTLLLPSLIGMFYGRFQKKIILSLFFLFAVSTSLLSFAPTGNPPIWAKIIDRATNFYTGVKVIEFGSLRCILGGLKLYSCADTASGKAGADFTVINDAVDPFVQKLVPGDSALLLGGGSGMAFENLPPGVSGTIVELDPNVIAFAQKYFGLDKNRYTVLTDDARHAVRSLKKEGGQFDLVIMDVIQDTKIPAYIMSKEAFAELAAITKKDGVLIIHGGISPEQPPTEDPYVSSVIKTGLTAFSFGEPAWRNDFNSRNLIFYFSDRRLPELRLPVLAASEKGLILTDDFNPLDYYNLDRQLRLTNELRSVFGNIALQ